MKLHRKDAQNEDLEELEQQPVQPEEEEYSLEAVSYTHLDVYKRQILKYKTESFQ